MEWWMWLIVAGVFGVGEGLSAGSFLMAPLAGGALLAAVVQVGIGTIPAFAIFVVVSALTLATIRPLLLARFNQAPALRTGAAALIGQRAHVTERIDRHAGTGQVKIDGETWSARSYDQDAVIEAGVDVDVVEIKGATAIVLP